MAEEFHVLPPRVKRGWVLRRTRLRSHYCVRQRQGPAGLLYVVNSDYGGPVCNSKSRGGQRSREPLVHRNIEDGSYKRFAGRSDEHRISKIHNFAKSFENNEIVLEPLAEADARIDDYGPRVCAVIDRPTRGVPQEVSYFGDDILVIGIGLHVLGRSLYVAYHKSGPVPARECRQPGIEPQPADVGRHALATD